MNTTKSPMQIFDLDGTLTKGFDPQEGDLTGENLPIYDYWYRIIRKLTPNPTVFEAKEKALLDMLMAKNIDLSTFLIETTKIEIEMLNKEDRNDATMYKEAVLLTQKFFHNNVLELNAIKYLEYQLRAGTACVISTAGDESGAHGFIDGLVSCKLLPEELAAKIFISGTKMNWGNLTVVHMNSGALKLRGLELTLQEPLADIQKRTQAVFGDSPEGGDKALLDGFCPHSFVKRHAHNQQAVLPANCVFSNWAEIYANRDDIYELHARLMK